MKCQKYLFVHIIVVMRVILSLVFIITLLQTALKPLLASCFCCYVMPIILPFKSASISLPFSLLVFNFLVLTPCDTGLLRYTSTHGSLVFRMTNEQIIMFLTG